jgi:hypothetical protein
MPMAMNVGGKTDKVGAAPASDMKSDMKAAGDKMKSEMKAAGDAVKSEMKEAGDKMKSAVGADKK